jgi:hypothetical protein
MNALLFHERGTRQTLPLSVLSHEVQAGKHCPNGIVHYSGRCSIAGGPGGLLPAPLQEFVSRVTPLERLLEEKSWVQEIWVSSDPLRGARGQITRF